MSAPAPRPLHASPALVARVIAVLRILQALSPRLAARLAFWLFLRPQRRELAQSDAAFMSQARLHRIPAGGHHVQAYEWGTGARTALLLHGWGSRASRFAPLAAVLVERGWRVLALDAPGHGLSPGRSSSLPRFMTALDAVVAALGPVHAAAGHSLGALALACARSGKAAEWPRALQKVVLISGPTGAPFLVESFQRSFRIKPATAVRMRQLFREHFGADPEVFMSSPDTVFGNVPALVVHDRGDDIVPFAHCEELMPAMANARLVITEGLGHSALTRDAAIMQCIADFLDDGAP